MKRILLCLTLAFFSLTMCLPSADAQRHNNRHGSNERKESYRGGGSSSSHQSRSTDNRGGHSVRPSRPGRNDGSAVGNSRPGNSNSRPSSGFGRPASDNNKPAVGSRPGGTSNNRPGNSSARPNRPGHGFDRPSNGSNRPPQHDNGNHHKPGKPSYGKPVGPTHNPSRPPHHTNKPVRPGNANHRPGNGLRPGPSFGPNHVHRPPHHPVVRPPHHPWHRPVPPPHWRPRHHRRLMPSFLGLTFGMAMNVTLNALAANNFTYYTGSNEVILHNVNEQNYFWPEAILSYNGGMLDGSRFFYHTSYPDPSRFRGVYANLCATLGSPVSYNGNGYNMSASWLGYNGDYVTLEYTSMANSYGAINYYTILSYGN